jgi:hypothetical protein
MRPSGLRNTGNTHRINMSTMKCKICFRKSATSLISFLVSYSFDQWSRKRRLSPSQRPKPRKERLPAKSKAESRATSSKSDEKYKAQFTTRHSSHLTSDIEADIKEEVE